MFKNSKLFAAAGLCLLGGAADAATVTWGTPTDTTSLTDLASGGYVVTAQNGGDAGIGTVRVGDVDFVAGPIAGLPNVETNPEYITGSTGDANFDTMLSSVSWGSGPVDVTVNLLTPGIEYKVQFFYSEHRTAGWALERTLLIDGGAGNGGADLEGQNGQLGQSVIGTFVADGTSQTFSVNGDWGGVDITGFLVREAVLVEYVLGDTDGDGKVLINDYHALRDNFGIEADALLTQGDVDRDGDVDLADYAIIEEEFAKYNSGASLVSAIPEPASLALIGLGGLVALRRNKK